MESIIEKLSYELSVSKKQIENTIRLIDDGNTIPFIARYRKEVTGNLDDEILRKLDYRLTYLRNLENRKEEVIRLIDEVGMLTDKIKQSVKNASILTEVEDIYRPFKPKKRTRATIAKEKGLNGLANIILKQSKEYNSLDDLASEYINDKNELYTISDCINGACDIISEIISDNAEYRKSIRSISYKSGKIKTSATGKDNSFIYKMYYEFSDIINKIPSYRVLAINRGEKEGALKIKIEFDDIKILEYLYHQVILSNGIYKEVLQNAVKDSYERLIKPSIQREIWSDKLDQASEQAISVFGVNVKNLLLQPPLKGMNIMGFDPAYRTGCKIAVIDETGKLMATTTVYPTEPQNDIVGATKVLLELINKYNINMIAIGNGTASRESEKFIADLIKKVKHEVHYTIVSEAGASVYSASELATMEYPDVNVSLRGAISIARRLEDPLAELVKIDPKSIGVGQYQHDVNQKRLDMALTGVVESAVNSVGVDLNTATPSLLNYVSGINKTIATNIVKYREENGKFTKREELLKVPKLGKSAFIQCAGFLKVPESENILDNTMVHPESYKIAREVLSEIGVNDLSSKDEMLDIASKLYRVDTKKIAEKLGVGMPTIEDIVNELKKPGRDIRENMPKPILKSYILKIDDLSINMELKGTIRNVTQFGAFVDIGIKGDGLVHISQISDKFVKNPLEELSVGQIVNVKIIGIDKESGKVSLSMKGLN